MEYHHWSIWDEIWLTSGISTDPYGNTDPLAFSSRDDDISIKNTFYDHHDIPNTFLYPFHILFPISMGDLQDPIDGGT